jgi:UDP-N-acetyl-D-galactosamine dehydrogenase
MKTKICIVGLGYVGLPLACLLSKKYEVSGFDINKKKIENLKEGIDETGEIDDLKKYQIEYSTDSTIIKEANFIIVAVPTPLTEDKKPDLGPLKKASEIVGQNLTKGSIVVYESTVYPGCTEEDCLPILTQESGLKYGPDFKIGYSPERINPGDKIHTIDKVVKVVAGSDQEALEKIKEVYGSITQVHPVSEIKVAEAIKVIENVQRSLNIALMNELALIFDRMGISTKEVLEGAGTKWNFHKYTPGLVGGHCIGIDPYYLTYKAQELGYEPQIILSGQQVNESMVGLVASKFKGKKKILVMGLTFKENVPDTRNSKARDLIAELKNSGSEVSAYDPILPDGLDGFDVPIISTWPVEEKFDGIIIFSPHDEFKEDKYSLENLKNICSDNPILFDVKGFYDKTKAEEIGFKYLTL